MNGNRVLIGAFSALSLFVAASAVAVEQHSPAHAPIQQMGKMMGGGMSCDDMMGGGGMMNNGHMMPGLPPGNEKLNLQMHAEMMQAIGSIMQKYADKIVTPQEK